MSAVKNFAFLGLHVLFICKFSLLILYLNFCCYSTVIYFNLKMYVGIYWNIRNVELKFHFYPGMRLYFLMFITAVCFLFIHTLVLGSETSVDLSPQNNHLLDQIQVRVISTMTQVRFKRRSRAIVFLGAFSSIQSLSTHAFNWEKCFA